jgi:hypothetical protein
MSASKREPEGAKGRDGSAKLENDARESILLSPDDEAIESVMDIEAFNEELRRECAARLHALRVEMTDLFGEIKLFDD